MSIKRVQEYLVKCNPDPDSQPRVIIFDQSSATVELAAKAAGVEPARICKTLSFKLANGRCALIQIAGDKRIDNKKYRAFFNCKANMLKPNEVIDFTGYEVGGVCAFDIKREDVDIYCDESLKRFDKVFPSCGTSDSAVELPPEKLYQYTKAKAWIDVGK